MSRLKKGNSEELRNKSMQLYLSTNLTFQEIASMVNVGKDTIGDWAKRFRWREQKAARSITKEKIINDTLVQISELDKVIMAREQKYPTASEADIKIKLKEVIREMSGGLDVSDYISMSEELLRYTFEVNPELAKKCSDVFRDFVHSKLK